MPVPNSMSDLFQLASSNSPAGTEAIGNGLDNYIRAGFAIVRSTNAVASATIASASTTDIGPADGESVIITGTTNINSFGPGFVGCYRELRFSGVLTIVNSSNIVLPGSVNVTTVAGDFLAFRCTASGVWALAAGGRDVGAVRKAGDTMTGPLTLLATNPSLQLTETATGTSHRVVVGTNTMFLEPPVAGTVTVRGYAGGGGAALAVQGAITSSQNWISAGTAWVGGTTGAGDFYFRPNGVGSTTGECRINAAGDLIASGTLISSSDERLKTDWKLVGGDLVGRLAKVKSGFYLRTDTGIRQLGVSAQSLQVALPQAVNSDEEGYLSVAYANAALVGVIELAKEVVELRSRLIQAEAV